MKTLRFVLLIYTGLFGIHSLDANIVYVDVTNNSGIEDGTQQHPFNTIKEGVTLAVAGDTVMIRPGTYVPDDSWSGNDHTLLLKAGVSLVGESRDNTVIAGILVDQQVSNLSINLEKLRFDEFYFIRGTSTGPFAGQNIIRNCATGYIDLAFGAGIPVNDTTPGPNYGFLIENNDLGTVGSIEFKQGAGVSELTVGGNNCGYIQVKSGGGYTYRIENNDVTYGIWDKSATNTTTISGNIIRNGLIGDYSGGNQYGVEDQIIENNIITAAENSPAFSDEDYKAGIIVKSRSATIRNNTITCTGHVSGIRSSAGAPLHITGNTITLDEVTVPAPDPYEGTLGIFNYSGWGTITGNRILGGSNGYYSKAGTVEFSNNVIEKSYTGFYSMGAESVSYNIIRDCHGDGMILDGLRGPLHHNMVINNAGAGIRVTRVPIDLGGGADASPGKNTLQGNGNFDLFIETSSTQNPTLFAKYNIWDHENTDLIAQQDIRDSHDSTGLVTVDFSSFGGLGTGEGGACSGLDLSPNPVKDHGVIRNTGIQECRIELVDGTGKCIKTIFSGIPVAGEIEADFSNLLPGIYFLRKTSSGLQETLKIMIRQ